MCAHQSSIDSRSFLVVINRAWVATWSTFGPSKCSPGWRYGTHLGPGAETMAGASSSTQPWIGAQVNKHATPLRGLEPDEEAIATFSRNIRAYRAQQEREARQEEEERAAFWRPLSAMGSILGTKGAAPTSDFESLASSGYTTRPSHEAHRGSEYNHLAVYGEETDDDTGEASSKRSIPWSGAFSEHEDYLDNGHTNVMEYGDDTRSSESEYEPPPTPTVRFSIPWPGRCNRLCPLEVKDVPGKYTVICSARCRCDWGHAGPCHFECGSPGPWHPCPSRGCGCCVNFGYCEEAPKPNRVAAATSALAVVAAEYGSHETSMYDLLRASQRTMATSAALSGETGFTTRAGHGATARPLHAGQLQPV